MRLGQGLARAVFLRNRDLLRNAGSLAATTGVTSALGFAFWTYAARVFSSSSVGWGAAAISAMLLLGSLGLVGLDTMLIGELPQGGNRGGLVTASCLAAFGLCLALGLGCCLASQAFGGRFAEVNGTPGRMGIFAFGVAATGATFVFDAATIGVLRGGLQLVRNAAASAAKLAALPVVALVPHDEFGTGIMLAWVAGTVISLGPVAIGIKRGGGRLLHRPDWAGLWRLRRVALAHNSLNLAINMPTKFASFLETLVISPAANGAYYIATMVSSFLFMVPQSLSTVLFAVAAAAPEKMPEKLRLVLRMSLAIGLPLGLAMGLGGRLILSVFGAGYVALAAGPLWLLIAAYLPGLPNTLYIAVARAQGRFNQAAAFLTGFAVLRMTAIVAGGRFGGLDGLCYAMLAVTAVQALLTTPSVLRTAFGAITVRAAARAAVARTAADPVLVGPVVNEPVVDDLVLTGPAVTGPMRSRAMRLSDGLRLRQDAGLAALLALATPVIAPVARPDPSAVGSTATTWLFTAAPGGKALTDTGWWPDASEEGFRARQEVGMAALIAVAGQDGSCA